MPASASSFSHHRFLKHFWERLKKHPLAHVGPGLITGVADDDPSGIATYAQAGAQFGFQMLFTMPLSFPLMAAIQSMCARLGRVTGKGLSANIKSAFPPSVLFSVVGLLLIANILNIAADVAAMGEVMEFMTGLNRHAMTASIVMFTLFLQIFIPYHRYVRFLKWLTLSLLAYAAVLLTIHVPWQEVVARSIWPQFTFDREAATMIVGILGTTISPYLFFWQASEEIEDMQTHQVTTPLIHEKGTAKRELRRLTWDTWSGMLYSNVTAYFIMLATAVTLHAAGLHHIDTAAQAASALRPLAGDFAFFLFALGILGVGLIGVPVLAGSAGYALCEAMDWKWGLERTAQDARGFYGVIAISVLLGLILQYSPIRPMHALFWSAVINGIVAVPLIIVIILLTSKKSIMGPFAIGWFLQWLGWFATILMGFVAIWMFVPL